MLLRRTGGGEIEDLLAVRTEHGEHGVSRLLLLRLLGVAVGALQKAGVRMTHEVCHRLLVHAAVQQRGHEVVPQGVKMVLPRKTDGVIDFPQPLGEGVRVDELPLLVGEEIGTELAALLDAAGRFDPAYGPKRLTHATPVMEAALSDYAAQYSSSLSIPVSRYNQLRRVAYLCAEGCDASDAELVKAVCGELNVSAKVAGALIKEYRTLFCVRQLGDDVFSVSCGGDPAVAYDHLMRRTLLMQRMEEVLTPRELNLVRSYLGIGQPNEVGLTFQELAVRLNYNGPSGAEKAYKAALRKLKKDLYGGAYGRWLSAQKAIRTAKAEAEQAAGQDTTPQRTWWEEQMLAD